MKCPICNNSDSRVLDSRPVEDGSSIKRRRECPACGKRFTTYEVVDTVPIAVIKRDGREVEFDKSKIISGIDKAFRSLNRVDEAGVAEKIADAIEAMNKTLDVEEIQNLIEAKLMASKYKDVAKEYTNYRYLHKMARSQYN